MRHFDQNQTLTCNKYLFLIRTYIVLTTTQNNLLKSITKSTEQMYEIISKQSYGEIQLMVTCTDY